MDDAKLLQIAKQSGFTEKQLAAITYESGPYDITKLCSGMINFASRLLAAVEADAQPVAWQHRMRGVVSADWSDWATVSWKPQGPEGDRFQMRPLYAAPQPTRYPAVLVEALRKISAEQMTWGAAATIADDALAEWERGQ